MSDLDEASSVFVAGATSEATWDTESLAHHRRYAADSLLAQDRLPAEESARGAISCGGSPPGRNPGYGVTFVVAKEGEEQRLREILASGEGTTSSRPASCAGR